MKAWLPVSLGVVLAGCQNAAPELTTTAPDVPVAVSVAVGGVT